VIDDDTSDFDIIINTILGVFHQVNQVSHVANAKE